MRSYCRRMCEVRFLFNTMSIMSEQIPKCNKGMFRIKIDDLHYKLQREQKKNKDSNFDCHISTFKNDSHSKRVESAKILV